MVCNVFFKVPQASNTYIEFQRKKNPLMYAYLLPASFLLQV